MIVQNKEETLLKINKKWKNYFDDNRLKLITECCKTDKDVDFLENLKFVDLEFNLETSSDYEGSFKFWLISLYVSVNGSKPQPFNTVEEDYLGQESWSYHGFFVNEGYGASFMDCPINIKYHFEVTFDSIFIEEILEELEIRDICQEVLVPSINVHEKKIAAELTNFFKSNSIKNVKVKHNHIDFETEKGIKTLVLDELGIF